MNELRVMGWFAAGALAGALAGCAAPTALDAPEHRELAARQQLAAEHERAKFDPEARRGDEPAIVEAAAPIDVYTESNPTQAHLRRAARIEEHARAHEAAAAEIERFESAECTGIAPKTRGACPLIAISSIELVPGGVRIFFKDSVDGASAIALMRCHLAYARAQGFDRVSDCALYLRGVDIEPRYDARAVDMTARDAATVRTLQRRAIEGGR